MPLNPGEVKTALREAMVGSTPLQLNRAGAHRETHIAARIMKGL
ncbi:MAG: hypothetical protein AB1599_05630 [Planctomycetota bacterium]